MPTQVDICNVALARLGNRAPIGTMTEDTPEAAACNTFYANARDSLLESFPWPWASKRATLAVASDADRDGWTYIYGLPSDCMVPRYLYPGTRTPMQDEKIPFAIELNDAGNAKILLCDITGPVLVYTVQPTDTVLPESVWTPLFCDALAWVLARDVAMALAVEPPLAAQAGRMAEMWFQRAAAASANQGHEGTTESQFVRARD